MQLLSRLLEFIIFNVMSANKNTKNSKNTFYQNKVTCLHIYLFYLYLYSLYISNIIHLSIEYLYV